MKLDITKLFYDVDEFVKKETVAAVKSSRKPTRIPKISYSEIITIMLLFQDSDMKTFKHFYLNYLIIYKLEFPKRPSYERFVKLAERVIPLLLSFLKSTLSKDKYCYFIDATRIPVCENVRANSHKTLKKGSAFGKSSTGFFYGCKLHAIINRSGELCSVSLTKVNVGDRKPVEEMTQDLKGLIVGDKGYLSKELFNRLFSRGLRLVADIKKGMKTGLRTIQESFALRKRSVIESVFDILKNRLNLVHSRHRSPVNFLGHILSVLITYQLRAKKPSVVGYAQ